MSNFWHGINKQDGLRAIRSASLKIHLFYNEYERYTEEDIAMFNGKPALPEFSATQIHQTKELP